MTANNIILTGTYEAPCGKLTLGSFGDRLCLCDWMAEKHHNLVMRRLERCLNVQFENGTSKIIESASAQLDEYFAGRRKVFDMPLLFIGTDFQKAVWNELINIPFGTTISYRELALRIGRPEAVRAVANANGANAISVFIPCHRVIGNDGSLTGYAGGLDAKKTLLKIEQSGR